MRIDFKNTGGLIAEGFYEAVVKDACYDSTSSGKECIKIEFKIRDDVEQRYIRSLAWQRIFKPRDPTLQDQMCEGYRAASINILSRAAGFEDGAEFESIADWMRALIGRPVRIEIVHNEYNGKTYANIGKLERTAYPVVENTMEQVYDMKGVSVLEDEELPF